MGRAGADQLLDQIERLGASRRIGTGRDEVTGPVGGGKWAVEPSNFKESVLNLGVSANGHNMPAALMAHFVNLLDQGGDEALTSAIGEFLNGIEVESRPCVITEQIIKDLRECLAREEDEGQDLVITGGGMTSRIASISSLFDEPKEPLASLIADRSGSRELFSGKDLVRVITTAGTYQNSSMRNQYNKITTELAKTGPYRDFGFAPDVLSALDKLATELPNFSAVIEHIADGINLAVTSLCPVALDPMLIVSEPGIGKSYFVNRLHEVLGIPSTRLSLAWIHRCTPVSGGVGGLVPPIVGTLLGLRV